MAGNKNNLTLERGLMIISLILFLNISGTGQGLIISSGAKFISDRGNIVILGNLQNDGYLSNNFNTTVFAGTVQSMGGNSPVIFNNLTIASGSTTTIIAAGQSLKGILLSNGTLNSNGNITLLSTISQTALIDGTGTGQVNGNITMQRYLPSGFGYKYFSSPFQGATVNEFGNEINLLASFPGIYSYDESRVSSGWVSYVNPAWVLTPLQGFAVNFGSSAAAVTADATGVVSNSNLSGTFLNHNNTYTKGFNLIGNPYPSPINWDAATGWTKTNIDNALYYFKAGVTDQYTGTYSTYINGFSSDGLATAVIPSMQAFFIHVSTGTYPVTGTLAMTNSVRITDLTHQFLKSVNISSISFLRLNAFFADNPGVPDPLVIYFDDKALTGFDSRLDALKLMNTDQMVPNLYAVSADGYNLSINALPPYADSLLVVPLGIKTARNGSITFRIRDTINLLPGTEIYLNDKETGVNRIMNQGTEYIIYLNAGEYNSRFSLRFIAAATGIPGNSTISDQLSLYSTRGIIIADINLPPGKRGFLLINNISGQILFRKEIYEGGYHEFNPKLKTGIYIVSFITGNVRYVKKIFIPGK
jgi:hypothetical protein